MFFNQFKSDGTPLVMSKREVEMLVYGFSNAIGKAMQEDEENQSIYSQNW